MESHERRTALAGYRLGYLSGRSGGNARDTFKPTDILSVGGLAWTLGMINGDCALENAENGHDPSYD